MASRSVTPTRGKPPRGLALITVLTMSGILLMMVLALYISSRGGLFGSTNHQRRLAALYVAEAGLADTMVTLEAANWVTPVSPLTGTLPGGGVWTVRFKSSAPYSELDSVNNLANGAGAAESYRGTATVPTYSALIIVQAKVGGVERVVEAVITRGGGGPALSNGLQASGQVRMKGDVLIDGVKAIDDSTPVPGKVQSNGNAGTTVKWDNTGTINITGTVSAQGGTIDLAGYIPSGGAPTLGV